MLAPIRITTSMMLTAFAAQSILLCIGSLHTVTKQRYVPFFISGVLNLLQRSLGICCRKSKQKPKEVGKIIGYNTA